MKKVHQSIKMDKDQEVLLKALSEYLNRITGVESEKISRIIRVVLFELMTARGEVLSDTRFLPSTKREAFMKEAIALFLDRTKVNESYHEKITGESLEIYRKWAASVRIEPSDIEVELYSIVDELLESGVLGKGCLVDYNKRQRRKYIN